MILIDSTTNARMQLGSVEANISLLALEAANELDEIVEGRQAQVEAVKKLAQILKTSFHIGREAQQREGFVDSGSVAVFYQALDDKGGGHITTIKDLVMKAFEVVKNLEQSREGADKEGLVKMRDFCIALSKAASAHQQSIHEVRPSHPLRN